MVQFRSAVKFLQRGLERAGFTPWQIQQNNNKKNVERFRAHYGSNPIVLEKQWQDLQNTQIAEAKVNLRVHNWNDLLMTHYYMRLYPTEVVMSGRWNYKEDTIQEKVWSLAYKIAALKGEKVKSIGAASLVCVLFVSFVSPSFYCLCHTRFIGYGMPTTPRWEFILSQPTGSISQLENPPHLMIQLILTTRTRRLAWLISWQWH